MYKLLGSCGGEPISHVLRRGSIETLHGAFYEVGCFTVAFLGVSKVSIVGLITKLVCKNL